MTISRKLSVSKYKVKQFDLCAGNDFLFKSTKYDLIFSMYEWCSVISVLCLITCIVNKL